MQHIRPAVHTTCCGIAMSAAALVLVGGAPGKRTSLPNGRMLIHQPSGGFQGQQTDIAIHAAETLALRDRLDEIFAEHSGQSKRAGPRRHGARPLLHAAGGRASTA